MKEYPLEIQMIPLLEIKPYEGNPRINEYAITALVAIIREVGFNVPIVIDRDFVIVKGHTRYYAAQDLGMEKIPSIVSSNDKETNDLDRLADNKLQEMSLWDYGALRYELEGMEDFMAATGLDFHLVAEYPDINEGVSSNDVANAKAKILEVTEGVDISKLREIVCPSCGRSVRFDDIRDGNDG